MYRYQNMWSWIKVKLHISMHTYLCSYDFNSALLSVLHNVSLSYGGMKRKYVDPQGDFIFCLFRFLSRWDNLEPFSNHFISSPSIWSRLETVCLGCVVEMVSTMNENIDFLPYYPNVLLLSIYQVSSLKKWHIHRHQLYLSIGPLHLPYGILELTPVWHF